MTRSAPKKLLAVFGVDLDRTSPDAVELAAQEGFEVLALDATAARLADRAGVPWSTTEEWVEPDDRRRAIREARECERGWFLPVREEFTVDGLCWPALDRGAMKWAWYEAFFAGLLADCLTRRGVRSVRYIDRRPPRPGVGHNEADIFPAVWRTYPWSEAAVQRSSTETRLARARRAATRRLRPMIAGWRRCKPRLVPLSSLGGRVVVAMRTWEEFRLRGLLESLREAFPSDMAVLCHGSGSARKGARLAERWKVPVAAMRSGQGPPSALAGQFRTGFRRLFAAGIEPRWRPIMTALSHQFEHYGRVRWPTLGRNLIDLRDAWSAAGCRPSLVLASAIDDASWGVPGLAARELGAANVAISHGAIQCVDDSFAADVIVAGYPLQRSAWESAEVRAARCMCARGVVADTEYPAEGRSADWSPERLRILALTNPVQGKPHLLLPWALVRSQLEALRALSEPPPALRSRVHVLIKAHPRWPERELFELAGGGLAERLLPPDTSLRDLLPTCELVVAINYFGSALVHVLRAGVPVVALWTHGGHPIVHPELEEQLTRFRVGSETVTDRGGLWAVVERFASDEQYASALRQRAREFSKDELEDDGCPSLVDVLGDLRRRGIGEDREGVVDRADLDATDWHCRGR